MRAVACTARALPPLLGRHRRAGGHCLPPVAHPACKSSYRTQLRGGLVFCAKRLHGVGGGGAAGGTASQGRWPQAPTPSTPAAPPVTSHHGRGAGYFQNARAPMYVRPHDACSCLPTATTGWPASKRRLLGTLGRPRPSRAQGCVCGGGAWVGVCGSLHSLHVPRGSPVAPCPAPGVAPQIRNALLQRR